jgi:outer membrane protein assembly factor BamB
MSSRSRRPRRTSILAVVAATTAMGLTLPAAADNDGSPWSQHRGDADNRQQGVASGPEDPGLKWLVDLADVETDDAPEGYSIGNAFERFGDLNRPIVAPDGTLIMRASNVAVDGRDGGNELVGLDPDDGSVAWTIPFAAPNCGQAIDTQNRLWSGLRGGEIAAFDPATGEEIEDTRFEPANACNDESLHLGGDDEHLLLFRGHPSQPYIDAFDISGASPQAAWRLELHGEGAPFDRMLNRAAQNRHGLIAGDAAYVVGYSDPESEDGDATVELLEIALEDGEIRERVELPTFDGPASGISVVTPVRVGEALVLGVRIGAGSDGDGYLVAYDLEDGLSELWRQRSQDTTGQSQLGASGPSAVAVGDGVVHANAGNGTTTAYRLSDGQPQWSVDVAEAGGGISYRAVTDVQGRLFTHTVASSGIDGHAVTAISPTGTIEWQVTRAVIQQEANYVDSRLANGSLYMGPIDADGTLYVFRDTVVFALDDSGGLASCELPFDDVDPESNVHAGNICRLVQAGITAGIDENNYGPRQRVTRQQMATFLARALDLPTRDGTEFEDVNPNSVHAPNIYAIKDAGITAGVTATRFDPTGRLTRDQMATFLARAAELDPVDGEGFVDVSDDNVHRGSIYAVRDADITQGITSNQFGPTREVRRDQMASFLMRLVDYLEEQG